MAANFNNSSSKWPPLFDIGTEKKQPRSDQVTDLIYPTIFIIGTIANIFVIRSSYRTRQLNKFVVLICNMAIADLSILITGVYLEYYTNLRVGNEVLCQVMNAADLLLFHVSAFTMAFVAFERYLRFYYPQIMIAERQFLPEILSCVGIWIIAAVLASPVVFYGNFDGKNCSHTMSERFYKVYFTCMFVTSYMIPGLLVAFFNFSIIFKANSNLATRVIEPTEQQGLTHFLSAIMMLFFVLHLPFWLFMLSELYSKGDANNNMVYAIVLTYLNPAIDPFLYFILRITSCEDVVELCHRCKPEESNGESSDISLRRSRIGPTARIEHRF
ncbi:type-1 angiotensin II receptor B-like [Convolutriloba macropyga]|uniref:type-1 angiotensin II receptor B-like n=1 Tax=Convolutriloba macropyga TaxID=536237 RepID=UPI003F524732